MATLNVVGVPNENPDAQSWSSAELDLNSSGFNFAANAVLPSSYQKDNTSAVNAQSFFHGLLGENAKQQAASPTFDVGGLLYPYNDSMSCSIPTAPLSLCLHCGAYLNPLVDFEVDGRWYCALCGMVNKGLLNFDRSAHPELNHFHSEYAEHVPYFGTLLSEADNSHFVYFLSPMICKDDSVLSCIQRYLRESPVGVNVTIVIIGKALRLLRLGSHTFSPLAIDVVPLGKNGISCLLDLVKRGIYSATKEVILENFGVLESVLHSSFSSYEDDELSCLDQIVEFCMMLKETRAATRLLKVLLLIDAPLRSTKSGVVSTSCSRYDSIGRVLLQCGCVLYCIYIGLREGNFCEIDSLVAATGGVLTVSESFNEFHVQSLMQKLMRVTNRNLHPHDLSTVEVRCSSNLFLDRITGPMASLDDVAASRRHVAMEQNESFAGKSMLYFDEKHFDVAWRNANRDVDGDDTAKEFESARESLLQYCKDRVSICGVFPTEGSNTMLTFQFRENEVEGPRTFPSLSSVSKMMQVDSSRPEASASNPSLDQTIENRYVVQIVTRYYSVGTEIPSQTGASGSFISANSPLFKRQVLKKITRVWTVPFKPAASKLEFAANIDSASWGLVVVRGLVADFHEQLLEKFGGCKPSLLTVEDEKIYQTIRMIYTEKADNLLRDVAGKWGMNCGKLQEIARVIYHLREGPLLDGPSASPQEAFHMRSIFLKTSFTHSCRLLTPIVRLDIINLTTNVLDSPSTSIKHQPLPLKEMDAESTSLIPLTIALVDCGNIVVVRRNSTACSKFSTGMDGEAFLFRLKSIGEQICQARFPPSKFVVINAPGTPADRLIYSRLSPSHMELKDTLLDRIVTNPEFQWMTLKDIEDLVKGMPITDQMHFHQYLSLHAVALSKSISRDKRSISLPHQNIVQMSTTAALPPKTEAIERDKFTGLPLPTVSQQAERENLV